MCSLIFGNKPVVTITSPTSNATISGTSLTVTGTISDIDGDQSKVKVWIEDTSIVGWDYGVTSGYFEVTLTLSNLVDGQKYNIIAEGYDANNNVSDKFIISVTYSSGGSSQYVVTISNPVSNSQINNASLHVTGDVKDSNGNPVSNGYVKVWVDGHDSINQIDNTLVNGTFDLYLDLSTLSSGTYTIKAQWDGDGVVSNIASVTISYSTGGGASNFIQNATFYYYQDNYSGTYSTAADITIYLNNFNGDQLDNWTFDISTQYALDNAPGIVLNGSSVRYYSTYNDTSGNYKMSLTQNFNPYYTITDKTRIYIRFKIDNFAGGTNPAEAPVKIDLKLYNITNPITVASYSSYSGTNNNKSVVSNIPLNTICQYDFNLTGEANICPEPGQKIEYIRIWVNGWGWNATIYEIRLYEGN